jgi:hypothetical protein
MYIEVLRTIKVLELHINYDLLLNKAQWLSNCSYVSTHRYVVRAASNPGRSRVWDTRCDAVVFGAEDLSECQATAVAVRLNQVWRRWLRCQCSREFNCG